MKKAIISLIFSLLIVNFISVNAATQGQTKGKVKDPGPKSPMISVSLNGNGGTSMSSGVSNAVSFNPNVGIEVVWMNLGFGIDASTFTTKSNFDFDTYAVPLKNLDYLTTTNSGNSWRSTSILFGPSYTIPLGLSTPIPGVGIVVKHNYPKATLTLSVKGGITINQTPDFSIAETSTQKNIAFNDADTYKKNVLTFKPNVAFNYWLTEDVAINANVQYTMQNGQGEFITKYRDLSKVDFNSPKADLTRQQITSAPAITNITNGPDKYLSAGIGITYRFGKKGWDGSIKGNRKGITQSGIKRNEAENMMAAAEVKAIAETLVNMRKGWDGSVKGKKIENKANTDVKAIAETLVNIARKGWDGSIKGNKVAYKPTEFDIELVTEALENIRKGWDGSIKGNKAEYVANDADVKVIAETFVNLRKGWDGTVKGGNIQERGIDKKDIRKNEAGETISMNVTIGKQTQGATFGEKVNAGRINVTLVEGGCIILFPDNGFRVNSKNKTITALSTNEHADFGEKVNAGLHAAGGALAQGTSLLGGALPGGAVISAAVSSVGNLAGGAGGGAAAASYAKTADKKKKKVWDSRKDDNCDGLKNLPDGDYEFEVVIEEKASSKSKKPEQTQVIIEFSSISNVLKTKHDTAKNSVGNIR